MIEIKDLLLKSHHTILSRESEVSSIRSIISITIGVQIKSEEIKVQNGTIYLDIKPIYKNEIFLKKEEILLKIQELLGKKSPQGIR